MYRPTGTCRRNGTPSREPRSASHKRASERVGAARILAARPAVRADERARGFGNERTRTSQAPRGPGASPSQAQDLLRAWAGQKRPSDPQPSQPPYDPSPGQSVRDGRSPRSPRGLGRSAAIQHSAIRRYPREEAERWACCNRLCASAPYQALARHGSNRTKRQCRIEPDNRSIRDSPLPCMVAAPSLPRGTSPLPY